MFVHLLGIKCEPIDQPDMFVRPMKPSDIISRSFRHKPTANVGRGSEWHLGNIEVVDPLQFPLSTRASANLQSVTPMSVNTTGHW